MPRGSVAMGFVVAQEQPRGGRPPEGAEHGAGGEDIQPELLCRRERLPERYFPLWTTIEPPPSAVAGASSAALPGSLS